MLIKGLRPIGIRRPTGKPLKRIKKIKLRNLNTMWHNWRINRLLKWAKKKNSFIKYICIRRQKRLLRKSPVRLGIARVYVRNLKTKFMRIRNFSSTFRQSKSNLGSAWIIGKWYTWIASFNTMKWLLEIKSIKKWLIIMPYHLHKWTFISSNSSKRHLNSRICCRIWLEIRASRMGGELLWLGMSLILAN